MKRLHDNPLAPADAGLSALGLMMRVGGGMGLWIGIFVVLASVSARASAMVSLAFVLGIARSWAHGRAGHRLQQSAPEATGALALYFGLVLVHVAALFMVDANRKVAPLIIGMLVLTSGWPVIAFGLLMRPSARRVLKAVKESRRRIFPEDGGMIGAAALMAVAGVVGSILVALWCIMALPLISRAGFFGIIAVLLGLAFLCRSGLQAAAGIRGLRSFNPFRFQSDATRYFTASVITTILVCLLTLITGLQNGIIGFVMVVPVGALSMLWPSIIRNVGSVELRPDLEDDAPVVSASRDNGVVTLGFAMCAMAALGSAAAFPTLTGGAMLKLGATTPLWLTLGFVAITLWAGVECVVMSPRRKIAVSAYVVAAVGSAGYGLIQTMTLLDGVRGPGSMQTGALWIGLLSSVVALALPTIVAIQVFRAGPPRPAELESVF